MSSTSSIVKVIDTIVDDKIISNESTTTNKTLIYKAGSTLTPIIVTKVSY